MKRVVFADGAKEDLMQAVEFLNSRSAVIASEFLASVRAAVRVISEHPEAAPVVAGSVRRKSLLRFPYAITYRDLADRVRVLAVTHHARRPSKAWKLR